MLDEFDVISDEQDWNPSSELSVLRGFVYDLGIERELVIYARRVQRREELRVDLTII